MPNPARPPRLLVLRPYLSHAGRDEAYAHVDALVMHTRDGARPRRYGELRPLMWHEDGARPILHEGFRFTCQIDDRHAEPYAPRYGYMPEHGEVFTTSDLARFGKPLAALQRGMARLVEQEGRSEDLGQILARLARVLRVDGIVLLAVREHGSFFAEDHRIRLTAEAPNYGEVIGDLGSVARELHLHCAKRAGRSVA
ncbi:hypothetical protein [Roseomonas mucosa]